jgi:aminoglycoside phosphotransferase (APT) family kinase protein
VIDASSPDEVAGVLLSYLRNRIGERSLDYAEIPHRIFGGNRTFVYGFRLEGAPPPYSEPLILRVYRPSSDDERARLEAATQATLANLGYPTPPVLIWSDSRDTFGGAFMIMERLAGRPLMLSDPPEEMTAQTMFRQLLPELGRFLFGRWPRLLANVQVRLHRIDTESFLKMIGSEGLHRDLLGMKSKIGRLAASIDEHSIEGLRSGLEWLDNNRPQDADRYSICHGDFFPNQVFERDGAVTGVIDWGDVIVGPSELDVGIVKAGIETLPAPLGGFGLALQRRIARRYISAYQRLRSLDPVALRYGEAFRCFRTLLGVSLRRLAMAGSTGLDPAPNPYDDPLADERLVARFYAVTGVRVRPAPPLAV